jgi:hypothetical protein
MVVALAYAAPAAALTKAAGVIAGYNFSNLSISGQSDIQGRSSFLAGGVLDLGFNDRFGLRIEPSYVSKGAKATHHNAYWGTMDGVVFNLDYIDVPVLARYDLMQGEQRTFLLGGVGVSFATKREAELTRGNLKQTVDFADVFSSTDVSLDLGAGISVPAGAGRMTFDGRAAFGLMNINNGGNVTFGGAPLAVPSTWTHTVGFRLLATYLFSL